MKVTKAHFLANKYAFSDLGKACALRLAWKLSTIWQAPEQLIKSLRQEMRFYANSAYRQAQAQSTYVP